MIRIAWIAAALVLIAAMKTAETSADEPPATQPATSPPEPATRPSQRPIVLIRTSMGDIEAELFADSAPKTVANFLGLASGRKEFKDPKTGEQVKRPFYDGLTFHRVIPNFMIQGGCPLGTGTGEPGYRFGDEINAKSLGLHKEKALPDGESPHPWLGVRTREDWDRTVVAPLLGAMDIESQEELDKRSDEVTKRLKALTLKQAYENLGYAYDESLKSHPPNRGVLAMANSGPNTNGSQFFINVVDTPWLTGKHTVFGRVTSGMDVADRISKVKADARGKPAKPVTILSIRRKAAAAGD